MNILASPVARRNISARRAVVYLTAIIAILCLVLPASAAESGTVEITSAFSWVYILKLIAALGAVIGFFALFAFLMRRYQGFGHTPDNGLAIVASLSLGTRERLVVVQAGQKQVLLGITQTTISSLSELETPLTTADELPAASFKANLDKLRGRTTLGV